MKKVPDIDALIIKVEERFLSLEKKIDTLIAQRQSTAAILTRPNDEAGLEVVTSEESTAQDYWF